MGLNRVNYGPDRTFARIEGQLKQSRLHQLFLPMLVLAILVLLTVILRMLWVGQSAAITGLAAVAACFSALGALLVATRNQRLEEARRKAENALSDQKRAKLCRDIRRHYSAEISAWRGRRDLSSFIEDITRARSKAKVFQHSSLDVLLAARDSNRQISGPEPHPDDLREEVKLESKAVASRLALSAFANFPSIPSIWTTQFKREDIDLLGDSAPTFFVLMSLVWTNLTLLARQIPSEDDVVEFVRDQQTSYAKKYLQQLGEHIGEVSNLFSDFLTVVDKCVTLLLNPELDNPLAELEVPLHLVDRSRVASPNLAALRREIELDKTLERALSFKGKTKETIEEIADTIKDIDRTKAIYDEVRKKEQAALDEIENPEK